MKRAIGVPKISAVILFLLILLVAQAAWPDVTAGIDAEQSLETRVAAFAVQLRLGISVASFAASAPTLQDLRLHAQQLVNLLEGSEGRHYVQAIGTEPVASGLLAEATAWPARLSATELVPAARARLFAAVRNVRAYLELALNVAVSLLGQRRFEVAATDMLRIYAYLSAAYEQPIGAAAIPALRTLLRGLGIDEPEERLESSDGP